MTSRNTVSICARLRIATRRDELCQGTQTVTISPAGGSTLTVDDVIADQTGSGGSGTRDRPKPGGYPVATSQCNDRSEMEGADAVASHDRVVRNEQQCAIA